MPCLLAFERHAARCEMLYLLSLALPVRKEKNFNVRTNSISYAVTAMDTERMFEALPRSDLIDAEASLTSRDVPFVSVHRYWKYKHINKNKERETHR